jgi:hypothetical protein
MWPEVPHVTPAVEHKFNGSNDSPRPANCPDDDVLEALFNHLFGCAHRRISFPLTSIVRSGSDATPRRATYVACLECGAELSYNWEQMRVGGPIRDSQHRQPQWAEWRVERDEIG